MRIVNHSATEGDVLFTAIDDAGKYFGPITLEIGALAAVEVGSRIMNILSQGYNYGEGDWRLLIESELDIEPLVYVKTPTGFIDNLHDVAPRHWFYHRVALTAPNSLQSKGGTLRLINRDYTEAEFLIVGRDENGDSGSEQVVLRLPSGASRSISSYDLENGASGLTGRLGDGQGDWRLLIFADSGLDIDVMTLLDHASGALANLSAAGAHDREVLHFPSTADSMRRGELRLTSRSGSGIVLIRAIDVAGQNFGPVVVELEAERTVRLDSHDLEFGNATKGLQPGLGRGQGDWRLFLASDLDLEVFAYAQTADGMTFAMGDVAATRDRRHYVPLYNAANELQTSQLRLINPSAEPAAVRIQAWDDSGQSAPNGAVRISLPPGTTRSFDAADLQFGADELDGSFGEGDGNWRLLLDADRDIHVMSLVSSPDGALTNISSSSIVPQFLTACVGGSPDADGDGITDRCDAEPQSARHLLSACGDGTFVPSPGSNPSLVQDCRVLIGLANYEAQNNNLPDDHVVRQWGFGSQQQIENWKGVDTSGLERRVTELNLSGVGGQSGGLAGSIPVTLTNLTELTVLNLTNNQLSGSIPSQLGQLVNLTDLFLAGNRLTGEIPQELGRISNLRLLSLGNNRLNGPIPPELGLLKQLGLLELESNQLNGPIPSELGNLANLFYLNLQNNRLSGPIPDEIGKLSNLRYLYLSTNQLRGPIPAQISLLTNLDHLFLSNNQLSGPIPPELGRLMQLRKLLLGNNNLNWIIPPELGRLSRLEELWLYRNELIGPIPSEFGNLSNLTRLSLSNNRLSEAVPRELGRLSRLEGLWLNGNELVGPIPSEFGNLSNLTSLNLRENRLSGRIPNEVGQLSKLNHLDLSFNQLRGPIPAQVSQSTNLARLNLSNNQLSGPIPFGVGRLTQLRELDLSNNHLLGIIPSELGLLSRLTQLRLNGNYLIGAIPSEFGNLNNLTALNLESNLLNESIPVELAFLTELRTLGLKGNNLAGAIPSELEHLEHLAYLSLSDNRLTGKIPWKLWERSINGKLDLTYSRNSLRGVSPPPQRSRPVFSENPGENGNASHFAVAYFQGPWTWFWNWNDAPYESQRPLLGRWAALAVYINHETPTPPEVATRVLDSRNAVIEDRLSEAAAPVTRYTRANQWRTTYVFYLPGALYQTGNQIVHIIDPDNELAETNEDDNVGASIQLYGQRPPQFRITFIPLYTSGEEPPDIDPASLMSGALAYLPISDDFVASVGEPLKLDKANNKEDLLKEVLAIWNAKADGNEFYHGIFVPPWPGTASLRDRTGGLALTPGRVGVSELSPYEFSPHSVIPHEIGHNLSLKHPPGCDADGVDQDYPYQDGRLGESPAWDVHWRRIVSRADDQITDVMSYCGEEHLISDYHYRKATDYWLGTSSASLSLGAPTQLRLLSAQGLSTTNQRRPNSVQTSQSTGALAISGQIDSSGNWSLTHAQKTEKPPRSPPRGGEFTLILFDASGTELFREQLAPHSLSHGDEGVWAARTPLTQPPPREFAILDPRGVQILRDEIPIL